MSLYLQTLHTLELVHLHTRQVFTQVVFEKILKLMNISHLISSETDVKS